MKKINHYLGLVVALVGSFFFAVSCQDAAVDPDPNPKPDPTELTNPFKLSMESTSYLDASVKVEFLDGINSVGNYVVGVVDNAKFEELGNDAEDLAEYFIREVRILGADLSKADNKYVFNAEATVALPNGWTVAPEVEYVVAAFGVDAKGELTSKVATKAFTTDPKPVEVADIEFTSIVTEPDDIIVSVDAAEDLGNYILLAHSKASLEEDYLGDVERLADAYILMLMKTYNVDMSVADSRFVFNGDLTDHKLSNSLMIDSETEYVVFACGVDADGKLTSEVFSEEVTTPAFTDDDRVALTEVSTTAEGIYVDATPGSSIDKYYLAAYKQADLDEIFGGDIRSLARAFLLEAKDFGYDFTTTNDFYTFDHAITNYNAGTSWRLVPNTKYVVLAFGYDDKGNLNSDVVAIETATKMGDLEHFGTLGVSVVENTSTNIKINVDASDYDGVYFVDIRTSKEYADEYLQCQPLFLSHMYFEEVDAGNINKDIIDNKYLFKGDAEIDLNAICDFPDPDTEYMIGVSGVNTSGEMYFTDCYVIPVFNTDKGTPVATLSDKTIDTDLVFDVTPEAGVGNYTAVPVLAEDYERYNLTSEFSGIPSNVIAYAKEKYLSEGVNFSTLDNTYIFNGKNEVHLGKGWDLVGEQDYVVVVYGVDANGDLDSDVEIHKVTTPRKLAVQDEVEVELLKVTSKSAYFETRPGDDIKDLNYLAFAIDDDYYSLMAMGSDDPAADWIGYYPMFFDCPDPIVPDNVTIFNGDAAVSVYDLSSNTLYHLVVGAINEAGELVGTASVYDFTTSVNGRDDDSSFQMELQNSSADSFEVLITPYDYSGNYYVTAVEKSIYTDEFNSNAEKFGLSVVTEAYNTGRANFVFPDNNYTFKGEYLVNLSNTWNIEPSTDYVVVAVGVNSYGEIITNTFVQDYSTDATAGNATNFFSVGYDASVFAGAENLERRAPRFSTVIENPKSTAGQAIDFEMPVLNMESPVEDNRMEIKTLNYIKSDLSNYINL